MKKFLRDNFVLVAAFALPGAVAALFAVAMAVPKWTVAPPQHDLVLRIENYESRQPQVTVDFILPGGRLEAVVRPLPKPANPAMGVPYGQRWALLLFDHRTLRVREIPFEVPQSLPEGESRTVIIDELAGRRVLPESAAPDGYTVSSLNTGGGGGIVAELFGMDRNHRRGVALSKSGRTIEVQLPSPYRDSYGAVFPIGWVADDGGR